MARGWWDPAPPSPNLSWGASHVKNLPGTGGPPCVTVWLPPQSLLWSPWAKLRPSRWTSPPPCQQTRHMRPQPSCRLIAVHCPRGQEHHGQQATCIQPPLRLHSLSPYSRVHRGIGGLAVCRAFPRRRSLPKRDMHSPYGYPRTHAWPLLLRRTPHCPIIRQQSPSLPHPNLLPLSSKT
jgi:hypothetical protein